MNDWLTDFNFLRKKHRLMGCFVVFTSALGMIYGIPEMFIAFDLIEHNVVDSFLMRIAISAGVTLLTFPFGKQKNKGTAKT